MLPPLEKQQHKQPLERVLEELLQELPLLRALPRHEQVLVPLHQRRENV